MRRLARRQGITLSDDAGWHDDVDRLIGEIRDEATSAHAVVVDDGGGGSGGGSARRDSLARDVVLVAALSGVVGGALRHTTGPQDATWGADLLALAVARTVAWALIVGAVAALIVGAVAALIARGSPLWPRPPPAGPRPGRWRACSGRWCTSCSSTAGARIW